MASSLSPIGASLRRNDPDRFFTALFAPAEKRETLFTLYAFNHELARAREVTREPMIALMRLQWWREVIEGARKSHEIASPLRDALDRGDLDPADLAEMIDAREIEADSSIPTLDDWLAYLHSSAGALSVAASRLLGAPDPEATRPLGAAYGAAGVLRSVPFHAAQQRCLLPADILARHGLSPEAVIAVPHSEPVRAVIKDLARVGQGMLRPVKLPRSARAAGLVAALARRDLHRVPDVSRRGLGDKFAVTQNYLFG